MYKVNLKFTLNQQVNITPFNTVGKITEIIINPRGILYEVRYFKDDSIHFSYLYEEELECVTS